MRSVTKSVSGRKKLLTVLIVALAIGLGAFCVLTCSKGNTGYESKYYQVLEKIKTLSCRIDITHYMDRRAEASAEHSKKKGPAPKDEGLMKTSTLITEVLPDKLRAEISVQFYPPMEDPPRVSKFFMLFDGEYQWTGSDVSSNGSVQCFKIKISEVTSPSRPFDTWYTVTDCGLMTGEGLIGTVRHILRLYDFKPVAPKKVRGITCDVLEGQLDETECIAYLKERYFPSPQDEVTAYKKGFIRIYFAQSDHFIRRYEVGSRSNGLILRVYDYTDIKLNHKISPDTFVYTVPPGVTVGDITENVKLDKKRIKEWAEGGYKDNYFIEKKVDPEIRKKLYKNNDSRAFRLVCANNLTGFYQNFCKYIDAHGYYPPNGKILATLSKMVEAKERFCPSTVDQIDPVKLTDYENIVKFSNYETIEELTEDSPGDTPIMWDKKGNHEDYRNVLLLNGEKKEMNEEDFQKLMKEFEGKYKEE